MTCLGKPYLTELKQLDSTYDWALNAPIDDLKAFVKDSSDLPLLSVGSGGSLTAAAFTSLLHQENGKISQYVTPLELVSTSHPVYDDAVLMFSAGGRNADITTALETVARNEPQQLMVICATKGSKLRQTALQYNYIRFFEFDGPWEHDGFLATNSLLAFALLVARAYTEGQPSLDSFPVTLDSLVHPDISRHDFTEQLERRFHPLLKRDTLVVLHGKWGKPAAIDIESKLTEAALANAQVADYRNFAHGRHHWLAKKGGKSSVLALVTSEDAKIADRTLRLIPDSVPILRIYTERSGPSASIDLLARVFFLVAAMGKERGIDPGRPGVPLFGSRIYHLGIPHSTKTRSPILSDLSDLESTAISRKLGIRANVLDKVSADFWKTAFRQFIRNIEAQQFGAIVLDYDGTLCETTKRFSGASAKIGSELSNFLRSGDIVVGVATGRGKSVRDDLRGIIPSTYWKHMIIGYYNASDIGLLGDDNHPDKNAEGDPIMESVFSCMQADRYLNRIIRAEKRPRQITCSPVSPYSHGEVVSIMRDFIGRFGFAEVEILESSHSIDVLAPGVSKLNLVREIEMIRRQAKKPNGILCIGDQGRWPGNDYALLSQKYSLSVHRTSLDPDNCWNLAPEGHRGVQAAIDYFHAMEINPDYVQFLASSL